MRRFSFAPRRFESWTAPRRKCACAIQAAALLSAKLAGDSWRPASGRHQAHEALQDMTAENLMEVGICADFREICMRFALSRWAGRWGEGACEGGAVVVGALPGGPGEPGYCAAWTSPTGTPR